MRKYCKCCQGERLAVENKRTHGCTGVLALMILCPIVTAFVGASHGFGDGVLAGVATFFISAIVMSAKSYHCGVCGSKV